MTDEMERRIRTAAQIAHYSLHLGLLRYQTDEAVRIGMSLMDKGKSGASAYEAGRRVADLFVQDQIRLHA